MVDHCPPYQILAIDILDIERDDDMDLMCDGVWFENTDGLETDRRDVDRIDDVVGKFQQRMIVGWVAFLLIGSFAIVTIAAGHGVGPVGLLLVLGRSPEWRLPIYFGWAGVFLTIAAVFYSQPGLHTGVAVLGLACIAGSWQMFYIASEAADFTLMTSIPLFIFALIRVIQLCLLCAKWIVSR